jgi:hypothetical protein
MRYAAKTVRIARSQYEFSVVASFSAGVSLFPPVPALLLAK